MTDIPPIDATDAYPSWFQAIRRVVDILTTGLNVVGTLLIVLIMLLINADVIGRGLFNSPVSGVPEMVSMSIVAIVFLQIAQTFAKGRLTRTDAILGFVERRAPRLRIAMDVVFAIAASALIWQILAASTPLFRKAWVRNTFEGTIGDFTAPIWPVKLIILIGCSALLVQLVLFGMAAMFRLVQPKGDQI
jgi:TRAP-type mannitol/chloroaromatic compound transport system permease small subunit